MINSPVINGRKDCAGGVVTQYVTREKRVLSASSSFSRPTKPLSEARLPLGGRDMRGRLCGVLLILVTMGLVFAADHAAGASYNVSFRVIDQYGDVLPGSKTYSACS